MNTFSFVGKIVPVKDTESFKGYTETTYDSGWMKQRLIFNVVAGDNRHLVEINAGRWKDDAKNSVIYTMSKATEGKKSEKIQIPWEKRNDQKTIEGVAGYRVFTIDTDTYSHRESLKEAGDTEALEKSNEKRRHFLAGTDFCDFLTKKVVYNEKIKDWVFRINGNIVYSYSEKTGRYYQSYEVNKIYRVDEDAEPTTDVNIEFYFANGFMDKDGVEDTGKAIMNGFTPFYDQNTQKNWFLPIALVMRDVENVDLTEELLSEFEDNEICKAVLSCKAINGAQRRNVNLEDLDEKTQKAVKAGLMSESQAIRNAGGQVYGEVIQELRFDQIVKPSECTAYTLDNMLEKPHKEEEAEDNAVPFDMDEDDDI